MVDGRLATWAAEFTLRRAVVIGPHERQNAPQIVVRLHHQPHLGHRGYHILLGLAAVALALQYLAAVGNQPEKCIVIAAVNPDFGGQRRANAPAPGAAVAAAASGARIPLV